MDEFDPLNSPSRTHTEPVVSDSPFSSLFAPSLAVVEPPPLIDFTSSPSPPPAPKPAFNPKPLALASARQNLFPPPTSNPRRSSPLKFSILEDSFSDFPPAFSSDTSPAIETSRLGAVPEHDCEEGGLVSFVQDSPPPSLSRHRQSIDKENTSPTTTTRVSVEGKKWGVMRRMKEERARRRSRSLSPVKESAHSPFNRSVREGDSIAQIGNVDLSLIQDEAGSFLLADDDSTLGASFDHNSEKAPMRSPGDLSQIGEEDEEETETSADGVVIEIPDPVIVDEGASIGLSTMFLNKGAGGCDMSLIGEQSKLVGPFGGGKTFDQSTLPRHFQPSSSDGAIKVPRSKSTSSILPPELVSPVKTRAHVSRAPPSATKVPTPVASLPVYSIPHVRDESQFSMALPTEDLCSFLNKSSQSFIKECKSPRKKGRISDVTDESEDGTSSGIESAPSRGSETSLEAGETTEFGFTRLLGAHKSDTSTAILNQMPPASVLNPETTTTIELCLQAPLRPDNSITRSDRVEDEGDADDLASSTRTLRLSKRPDDEVDLMGMEEPSLFYQNQTLAFAGDMTIENQSVAVANGSSAHRAEAAATKETGAERLKRRMAELRAQQSLYTIPATPVARSSTSSRFVSLLDQTPLALPSQSLPRSTVRGKSSLGGPALGRSKSENGVAIGNQPAVGKLISFDTPAPCRASKSTTTPARISSTPITRRAPRSSLAPTATPSGSRHAAPSVIEDVQPPKTPGERKETTRARLERMRSERKQREEDLLRRSNSPPEITTAIPEDARGGGLRRSNSVRNRLTAGERTGIARSRSSTAIPTEGSDPRGRGLKPTTLTERMAATSSSSKPRKSIATAPERIAGPRSSVVTADTMAPPTHRRASSLQEPPPPRLVKRPSLVPTTAPRPSLVPTTRASSRPTLAKPAGSGSTRK